MEQHDIGFPVPGNTTQDTTSPGDLPLVVGEESLRRWIMRLVATEPGTLLHRPDFGVGVESYADLPINVAATRLSNAIKAQVKRDRRVRECRVTAGQSRTDPRRLDVSVQVVTVDGTSAGTTVEIAIGL